MPSIKSTLVAGAKPEAGTLLQVQEKMGTRPGQSLEFMVFEVEYDRKKYYCCWAGGEIKGGEPHMTLVGQAAVEALSNLPQGRNDSLIFQELKLGSTPLRNKVKATLKRAPANSKSVSSAICKVSWMDTWPRYSTYKKGLSASLIESTRIASRVRGSECCL